MTKDKLTKRHLVPRNPVVRDQIANPNRSAGKHRDVRRNVERNLIEESLNGMSWDDWVEYAERMDLSRKRILMGAQTKYREMYMEEIGETND